MDLKRLSSEHLRQEVDGHWWIHIKRQKTGTDSTIRLLDIPLQIIEKYRAERTDEHIFNVYAYDKICYLMQPEPRIATLGSLCILEFHVNASVLEEFQLCGIIRSQVVPLFDIHIILIETNNHPDTAMQGVIRPEYNTGYALPEEYGPSTAMVGIAVEESASCFKGSIPCISTI